MSSKPKTNYDTDTADWLNDQFDPKGTGKLLKPENKRSKKGPVSRYDLVRYGLFAVLISMTLLYIGSDNNLESTIRDGVANSFSIDEGLIEQMGVWMSEMGYGELSREELLELREAGVTATFTSRLRELGYTDLTIDDLKRMRQAGVTETFAGMMHELGYKDLTKEDLILLKQRGLTADFTAKVQNLGFPDITKEDLIRLRNYTISTSFIERAQTELGKDASLDDIIKYKIRNQ
jgi:hypothetical protein